MFSFSSDSKYFIITDGTENWKLEKNQVSFKWVNELVIIDRNGMHYKNIPYTQIVGGFASASQAVSFLETLVNTGQVVIMDTSTLATKDNQTNGSQLTKITDGAGVVNTKQLGTALTNTDVGIVANTTIHGRSSSGGGTFVDVKVNPAGKLEVNDSDVITTLTDGTQKTQIIATQETGSYPDPSNISTQNDVKPNLDAYGNLRTRGVFLTDELSFRDDFSGSTLNADWIETKTTNGSYTVANSNITINSGTTSGNIRYEYPLDFGPLTFRGKLSLNQRIANQEFIFGFTYRDAGVIQYGAWLSFSGTNNQLLNTYTASSSDISDLESNINITIPNVLTTASELNYKIDLSNNTVSFSVSQNGQFYYPISQHVLHIPDPYAPLNIECGFINTNTVVSTSAVIDMLFINNMNRIQIDHDFTFEPLPSQLIGSIGENLKQVGVTNTGALKVELAGNNVSAFGDINVNMLEPVLQVDFVYGILSAIGITTTTNGGTADTNAGRLRLQTGTNIAGTAQYQTTKVAKYRPGQGIDARFSYAFTTGVTNSIQLAGMGDLTNGYFFGYSGTSYGIFHYNNGSLLQFIPQSSWNVDPCNGKGISRIVINPTFGNIYKVKYPYLGFGDVPFFIQNPNDGQFQLVHIIKYANSTTSTQLSNPNLSFFAYMANTGNNTNLTGYSGSAGVFLSGERKFLGQTSFAYNNKALTAAGGLTNLFTIRNAATFNTITNKSLIRLNSIIFSVGNLGNNQFGYLQLLKNATLGGVPVYNPANGTTVNNGVTITNGQSPASIDVAGTTVTGGIRVWGTNGVNTSNAFIDVTAVDIFIAPGETLTLAGIVTANASLSTVANYVLDI